ncbi:type VII secretion protein EccB [Nocardiopsis sp. LOL_012]|uniref:type VII secretion protein EccB n=1 Tax=Nocardiopsis sp. LOL_012 TaxID=3345409 RepID=UPI003A85749F
MQSRRDRVMAYNFTVGRLGTAMLEADPDAVDAPMRRTRTGTYIGLAIALVLCVGFLVFGLIFPGGASSWREEGNLVVDKDSGAAYLYADGALRPVANFASARLIQGSNMEVSLVSADSLEGVPMGGPVGIAGAPDSLPGAESLEEAVWRLCVIPTDDGERARTALTIDAAPAPTGLTGNEAVLVTDPEGGHHLLWRGTRLRIDEDGAALQALGYGTSPAYRVTGAFLDAVPTAPDLAARDVPGAGSPGRVLAGGERLVGQVFTVPTPERPDQHYLLSSEGLEPLTLTEALLLLADPAHGADAYPGATAEAIEIPAGEAHDHLAAGVAVGTDEDARVPTEPPVLLQPGGAVPCLRLDAEGSLSLTLDPADSVTARPFQEMPAIAPGCPTPDLLGVPAGGGAVVRARPVGGSTGSPTHYLVTDTAAKYPVASEDALAALGASAQTATEVPTSLLRLLPTGPVLHPDAAALPLGSLTPPDSGGCR